MLLTEQEVDALRNSLPAVCKHQDVIRAAESAVLEKLKAQEPFAFHHDEEGLSYSNYYTGTVPLYEHPLPPDDVVRDAERYRWLRDSGKGDDLIRGDCRGVYLPEAAALDEAIDAFIKER